MFATCCFHTYLDDDDDVDDDSDDVSDDKYTQKTYLVDFIALHLFITFKSWDLRQRPWGSKVINTPNSDLLNFSIMSCIT